jgi:hypothetical protein
VESSLLNGRTFRSLEHLNEVTAWWLAERADKRTHRETQQRPVDRHAEERPYLIELPEKPYDVAQVVYRIIDCEGCVSFERNRYSVPWQHAHPGQTLPVKVTEQEVILYGPRIDEIARHPRFPSTVTHQKRRPKEHQPPRDQQRRREVLREQFAALGDVPGRFLEGLLRTQRNGWHQAQTILALLGSWHRRDLLAAMERAVTYGAFSRDAIERILAAKARPKRPIDQLADDSRQHLDRKLTEPPLPPRPTSDYQRLLFENTDSEDTGNDGKTQSEDKVSGSDNQPREDKTGNEQDNRTCDEEGRDEAAGPSERRSP